jgi:tRNA(Arg) A34 adenosine deaminase TadA
MISSSMGVVLNARRAPTGNRKSVRRPAPEPGPKATNQHRSARASASDLERMAALAAFTARSLSSPRPRPFGASIVHTKTGKLLLLALNRVAQEFDPSAHAEVRAIRLAAKRLKQLSLEGYTLYTTCEPCPMCMSAALWSGLDRVVYGATIEDANKHCNQILIPAVEVVARSDMKCAVDGPVLRDKCYALFTDARMLRAFRLWPTRKGTRKQS